ncbi:Beta-barrel assembly machine subunit BamD [Edaphobacter aggregans]|uniref:Beta-barrel assembly machine subunit BamD n=1 Tax=Edaphobacter aggregans TaxID=570835 RepID=A0A428MLR4_9BACT|nr:outer membrane protein assembly factor BamD [Edaphobacter aggregans]RSL17802.1 Beta-barrel assembly machine subunit BamD [Edaphobacter aggregans]
MSERSFFPSLKAGVVAGLTVASLLAFSAAAVAQATDSSQAAAAPASQSQDVTLTNPTKSSKKENKVVPSKDTKQQMRKEKKLDAQTADDAKLPDRQLYDKALDATKKGHFDVARLTLQTLLNTYPDSQYQMKAKLAIADSWYREGGTAALTQAESEYKDFITFFPNAPEAAEAQMRVGDIYFRQLDKPDRDYSKAVHAQEEYRLMLQQFPESTLVPQAKQRLREVQEVLATRESDIASYYASRENWPATIARYQTVVDTYPLFSHMDDVLVGLGDSYEAEARFIRNMKLPEDAKARLEKIYDERAADAYRKVVLEHSASAHVEDARDRLAAMNLPIPNPTPEQAAASAALENSRRQYALKDRAKLLILRQPDVVMAARDGEPPLADPKPTLAPQITKQLTQDFNSAMNPGAAPAPDAAKPVTTDTPTAAASESPSTPAAPLQLQEVPAAPTGSTSSAVVMTNVPGATTAPAAASGSSNSMGIEIVSPSAKPASSDNGGLKAVGPTNTTAIPAIEKPAVAPDQVNDVPAGSQPAAQAAGAKKTNPSFDKSEESSSKHKKKKGLSKLNPF